MLKLINRVTRKFFMWPFLVPLLLTLGFFLHVIFAWKITPMKISPQKMPPGRLPPLDNSPNKILPTENTPMQDWP